MGGRPEDARPCLLSLSLKERAGELCTSVCSLSPSILVEEAVLDLKAYTFSSPAQCTDLIT